MHLPLWSYTAVGWDEETERFVVAATRVDANENWTPGITTTGSSIRWSGSWLKDLPDNRLLTQLARCAVDYHCFAAKNLFFRRWEAPLPTSPACNSRCLGCISLQPSDCCPSNHERINFVPTPEEIVETGAAPSPGGARNPSSPTARGARGTRSSRRTPLPRQRPDEESSFTRATVNFNSNGSFPDRIRMLCDAGMDSMRFSMNSVREEQYNMYYRPVGYTFSAM